jgi:hypothetical protein
MTEEGVTFSQLTNSKNAKIRQGTEIVEITAIEYFINKIMLEFSIKSTPLDGLKEEIRDIVLPVIIDTWPDISVRAIFLAARLANQGKLTNDNGAEFILYPTITPNSVSNLIKAYKRHFKSAFSTLLKNQELFLEEKKPTMSSLEIFNANIGRAFHEVNESGFFAMVGIDTFMYDFLVEQGKIKGCEEFMEDALIEAQADAHQNSIDPSKRNKRFEYRALAETLADNALDHTDRILNRSKRMALTAYIRECIMEGIKPNEVL